MLVVDTSVWIDFFNGLDTRQTEYLDHVLGQTPILVGDLILAEILQGFRSDYDFERALKSLDQFTQVNMVNPQLAEQSARNYRILRQRGFTVRKTIDSLIATFCLENDHGILHNDRDYDPYEAILGLNVVKI